MNGKNLGWVVGIGLVGLAGVAFLTAASTDYSPGGTWARTLTAAESASFAWAGFTYTGPFTNRYDEAASRVRTMEALEAMAAVPVSTVMASSLTNYTTNYMQGYVSNYVAGYGAAATNFVTANFGSATVTNTLTAANFLLSAPRWVDSMSPAATWITGGSALSWNTNFCGYQLQKGDIGFGNIQFDHYIKEASITIYPHVHYLKTAFEGAGSANTNIVLNLAIRTAKIGGQWSAWTSYQVTNGVNPFATNIETHNIVDIPAAGITVTGGISQCVAFRLSRVNIADDNYSAGDIVFTHVDIHYPIDTLGSTQATSK